MEEITGEKASLEGDRRWRDECLVVRDVVRDAVLLPVRRAAATDSVRPAAPSDSPMLLRVRSRREFSHATGGRA